MPGAVGPYRKVTPGEPLRIHSQAWNSLMDLAISAPARPSVGEGMPTATGLAHINNTSGLDCPRFGVMGLVSATFARSVNEGEFRRRVTVDGDLPDDELPFAVMTEAIPDGFIGTGVITGATQVLLHVINEAHSFALVESGQMGWLKTGATGPAQIVWKEPIEVRADPDYAWAIVILGGGGAAGLAMFPVTVTIDGGSAGSDAATCTFTYEVKALDGSVIGTGKTPEKRRFTFTEYSSTPAASPGTAYFDSDNVLHLFDANELPMTEACP